MIRGAQDRACCRLISSLGREVGDGGNRFPVFTQGLERSACFCSVSLIFHLLATSLVKICQNLATGFLDEFSFGVEAFGG